MSLEFHMDWGVHSILRMLSSYQFDSVLDIGSGAGEHSRFFRHFGKQVFSVDLKKDADYVGDFMAVEFDRQFDAIWCSHALEHQRNVGAFLEKIYATLKDDGVLAITVPAHPREHLISGHVTTWNAGLLCYNLILAGFDCRLARVLQSYEVGLIVNKQPAQAPDILQSAAYDMIDTLAAFFPFPVSQGSKADVEEVNWGGANYTLPQPVSQEPYQIVCKYLQQDSATE